ncbi:MAG: hypothetical protein LBS77_05445 [Desulfovibrio sp.]|jgi:hypothetical protein|nr:hypothetical protein [Desulfovibrio sp.]
MFSIMMFMFLVFLGIVLILFYMMRASERRHNVLREELAKTQDMLRALEARLPAPVTVEPATVCEAGGNAPSEYVIDGPLTMAGIGAEAPRKADSFDIGMDLHFGSGSGNKQ